MKIAPILLLKDKEIIPKLEGVISELYPPSKPTTGQEKAGIHAQDFVLLGDDGVTVKVQIMDKGMHLPRNAKGQHIELACTPGDRGASGISVNLYKPENKDAVFKVCVSKYATMSLKELVHAPAAARAAQDTRRASQPTLDDHCEALEKMIERFSKFLTGKTENLAAHLGIEVASITPEDGVKIIFETADLALRAATTVYIQATKDGLIKPSSPPPAEEPPPSTVYNSPKDVPVNGQKIETKQDVLDKLLARSTLGTLHEVADAAERRMEAVTLRWEEVYDELKKFLLADFPESAIDQAHDEHRTVATRDRSIGMDSEKFYRALCSSFLSFKESVATCAEPAQTQADNDEIPF